jgi:hypothetical protein
MVISVSLLQNPTNFEGEEEIIISSIRGTSC